jgi:hypothetical protein
LDVVSPIDKVEIFSNTFPSRKAIMRKSKPSSKPVPSRHPIEVGDEKNEPEIDLDLIMALPSKILETRVVDQNSFPDLLNTIVKVESAASDHRKLVSPNFHKFLSFCLNLLEREVQDPEKQNQGPSHVDPASILSPISLVVDLKPRESIELKMR